MWYTSVLATVALTVGLGSATPVGTIIVNYKFGLVGVVFDADQAVQVNGTHIGDPQIAPAPCAILMEFFDGTTGGLLKTTALKVATGQTQAADLGIGFSAAPTSRGR
jgi:hypothetical protein